jgi:hypothetical protein
MVFVAIFYVIAMVGLFVWRANDCDDVSGALWVVPAMLGGFVAATQIGHGWVAILVAFVVNPVVALLGLKLARRPRRIVVA